MIILSMIRSANINMLMSIILAAGAGTRMKSKIPKVLHKVAGISMIENVIDVVEKIGCHNNIVVVGHGAEEVKNSISSRNVDFVYQENQLGTGHAVMQAEKFISDDSDVIVLYGDTPLIRDSSIKEFIQYHSENSLVASILTTVMENPTGYGRILRDEGGEISSIVEEKDADTEVKKIKEINSGIYCFKGKYLKYALSNITNKNEQGEYYLTDVIGILKKENLRVGAFKLDDYREIMGVNSRVQLAEAERIMRERILENLMNNGTTIIDPNNTYIEKGVTIGRDTIIYPGTILKGNTIIGEDCLIGPNCNIEDSEIKNSVEIKSSTIIKSFVDEGTTIGPYAYLRPNSRLGKNVKIGDFVEVKNSVIGNNSKASHLSYIGDGVVGENVNIGCGVVFVNYDGKNKNKTIVEDNAFIGCNVNLISPVTIKKNSYIAAGSTITKDVPPGALSVARSRQQNKEGWVERKGLNK